MRKISPPAGLAFALALAAVMLGGCNAAITTKPLFTAADEAGAPEIRAGVWRFDAGPPCKVDETRPLIEWPDCAAGAALKRGLAGFYDRKTGSPVLTYQPLVLTAGTPRIAQSEIVVSGALKLDANPYGYAGVRPTRFDNEGRITAIAFWVVQCGPPPPGGDGMTARPLPGMIMKKDDPVCIAASPQALRAAAAVSEPWSPKPLTARWIRDGGP